MSGRVMNVVGGGGGEVYEDDIALLANRIAANSRHKGSIVVGSNVP